MKILITGSDPFYDEDIIAEMVLGYLRYARGEVLELIHEPTGPTGQIARLIARSLERFGVVDVTMDGPLPLDGVEDCWAFLHEGANSVKADELVARCHPTSILVTKTLTS